MSQRDKCCIMFGMMVPILTAALPTLGIPVFRKLMMDWHVDVVAGAPVLPAAYSCGMDCQGNRWGLRNHSEGDRDKRNGALHGVAPNCLWGGGGARHLSAFDLPPPCTRAPLPLMLPWKECPQFGSDFCQDMSTIFCGGWVAVVRSLFHNEHFEYTHVGGSNRLFHSSYTNGAVVRIKRGGGVAPTQSNKDTRSQER